MANQAMRYKSQEVHIYTLLELIINRQQGTHLNAKKHEEEGEAEKAGTQKVKSIAEGRWLGAEKNLDSTKR